MSATAGIVVIGDEILSGKFAEENAAFLIGELRSLESFALRPVDIELLRVTSLFERCELSRADAQLNRREKRTAFDGHLVC